jgi:arylsulfatase A-like enzyme
MTGWYVHNQGHRSLWHLLRPHEPSLFRYLKNAGYEIRWYGKNDLYSQEYLNEICSVRFGKWLYIRPYLDGYHLFDRDLLFDVENDPHEQHNLAKEKPEIVHQAVATYLDGHDQMMFSMVKAEDPMWTVINEGGPFHAKGHLAKYCERLEATGRGWSIPGLRKRHPREFN